MKKQLVKATTMVTLGLLAANLGAGAVSAAETITSTQDTESTEVSNAATEEATQALSDDSLLDQPEAVESVEQEQPVETAPVETPAESEAEVATETPVTSSEEVQSTTEAVATDETSTPADQEIKAAAEVNNGYQFGSTSYDNGDGSDTVAFAVTNLNTTAPLSGNVSLSVSNDALDGEVLTVVTYDTNGLAADAYEVTIENGQASGYVSLNPATVTSSDDLNIQFAGDYAEVSVRAPHKEAEYTVSATFTPDGGQGAQSDSHTVIAGENTENPGEVVDQGFVVINYVDQNGNNIAETETQAVNVGDDFTVEAKQFDGYELTSDATVSGTMETMDEVYVTFEYQRDGSKPVEKADLTVRYTDFEGNDIADPETIEVEKGTTAVVEAKDIEGYFLRGDRTQEIAIEFDAQTVTFVYTTEEEAADDLGVLTVKYVDTEGNELAESETSNIFVGFAWEATAKQIDGYTLVGDDYRTGTMSSTNGETVEFVYVSNDQPQELTNVTIQYVDQDWNSIATPTLDQGYFGSTYTAEAKEIEGYTLSSEATQNVVLDSMDGVVITFIYTKDEAPVDPTEPELNEGELVINYLDEDGKKIAESDKRMVKIGEEFTAVAKPIEGYTVSGTQSVTSTMVSASGTFVNFVYKANEAPVDPTDPEVTEGEVIIFFMDKQGRLLSDPQKLTVAVGDTFSVTARDIPGYTLVGDKTVTRVMTQYDAENGVYVNFNYIVTSDPSVPGTDGGEDNGNTQTPGDNNSSNGNTSNGSNSNQNNNTNTTKPTGDVNVVNDGPTRPTNLDNQVSVVPVEHNDDKDTQDAETTAEETAETLPQTGESAKTAGLLSLLGASIVGVVGLLIRKKF